MFINHTSPWDIAIPLGFKSLSVRLPVNDDFVSQRNDGTGWFDFNDVWRNPSFRHTVYGASTMYIPMMMIVAQYAYWAYQVWSHADVRNNRFYYKDRYHTWPNFLRMTAFIALALVLQGPFTYLMISVSSCAFDESIYKWRHHAVIYIATVMYLVTWRIVEICFALLGWTPYIGAIFAWFYICLGSGTIIYMMVKAGITGESLRAIANGHCAQTTSTVCHAPIAALPLPDSKPIHSGGDSAVDTEDHTGSEPVYDHKGSFAKASADDDAHFKHLVDLDDAGIFQLQSQLETYRRHNIEAEERAARVLKENEAQREQIAWLERAAGIGTMVIGSTLPRRRVRRSADQQLIDEHQARREYPLRSRWV